VCNNSFTVTNVTQTLSVESPAQDIVKILRKLMHNLISTFLSCYNSAKITEIDQDLTDSNIDCPSVCTTAK